MGMEGKDMSQLLIRGGRPLRGEVAIQGAKNSVLPILAATLLTAGQVEVRNCPRLRDVDASVRILQSLGCQARWEGTSLLVDTAGLNGCAISDTLMREMRSSAIFLGAILARCGQAELSYPGGCELGPRPIDLHLNGLRELGAEIDDSGGLLHCNAAREPEIGDLQDFLNACGGKVSGAGTSAITIEGGRQLHGCAYTVMPDRIAAATYLCAVASAGGEGFLRGAREQHLSTVTAVLREAGCDVRRSAEGIACACRGRPKAVRPVRTAPYPGFPTDAQAVLMAALLRSRGTTVFEENIFENRYRHVDELTRMGADIRVAGRVAVVTGTETLHGTNLRCTDLRGGAALCVAALAAESQTHVSEIGHIDRGYQDIVGDPRALGADIARIETEDEEKQPWQDAEGTTGGGGDTLVSSTSCCLFWPSAAPSSRH